MLFMVLSNILQQLGSYKDTTNIKDGVKNVCVNPFIMLEPKCTVAMTNSISNGK